MQPGDIIVAGTSAIKKGLQQHPEGLAACRFRRAVVTVAACVGRDLSP